MRQPRPAPSTFHPEKLGDFLEAAYSLDTDDDAWLAETSRTARAVWGRGGPLYDATNRAAFRTWAMHTIALPNSAVEALRQASSGCPPTS